MLVAPFFKAIKKAKAQHKELAWMPEMHNAFCKLKAEIKHFPVLGMPNYKREFSLFTHSDGQVMQAVLRQIYHLGHKPLAYFSGLLDSVMQVYFPCEQALTAADFAIDRSTSIVTRAPLTLYAENSVFAVIRKSTLTLQQVSGSKLIFSRPSLKAWPCHLVNPATILAHEVQEGEETHDCTIYTSEGISQAEEDPILDSNALFIDGSSIINQETR
ncbi:hypothetical protein NDU88_008182 [Pleurodeles waltl]|uniref:Reverse transcriptase/retrotransposon-derived protein RNase H-like domain-containing protein n=1 Tax=Pleurodeles waltl TaxID=8319 RepID=A0AAV7NX10_PLEWA|nr:hypothetical protein NDU88_008182 [Pleurodeles waltl]